eukprot:Sspe_Gene.21102::Locus_7857_Transcript_1_1_Confidence_1.000_Length_541::g.21102::m.21102
MIGYAEEEGDDEGDPFGLSSPSIVGYVETELFLTILGSRGLPEASHFPVLLSPASAQKQWRKHRPEMEAMFMSDLLGNALQEGEVLKDMRHEEYRKHLLFISRHGGRWVKVALKCVPPNEVFLVTLHYIRHSDVLTLREGSYILREGAHQRPRYSSQTFV